MDLSKKSNLSEPASPCIDGMFRMKSSFSMVQFRVLFALKTRLGREFQIINENEVNSMKIFHSVSFETFHLNRFETERASNLEMNPALTVYFRFILLLFNDWLKHLAPQF